ncbi:MAG: RNA methyltransferase [Bacteroidales bacterium]|nr:RNA methyltransferase [Bacteroidales bacterium]MBN2750623.1 RNA methyltransferase [Bacteroidales bacterium]
MTENRKLANDELNRLTPEEYKQTSKLPVAVVLDNIRSLNNIGSVFRTSDALGVERIYLCGISGTPPHRDIHKTALGAEDAVPWQYFEHTADAIRHLAANGYTVISLEQTEKSINLIDYAPANSKKYALVFGNEVKGVSQEVVNLSNECIEIPQFGTKHSFNISVTAAIVLWDFFSKIRP